MKTILSLITVFPLAAAAQSAGTEFLVSSDSEGFEVQKISAEYFPADIGIRATHYRYGNEVTKDGQRVTAVGRAGDYANGYSFDLGVARQSNHTQVVGDASYRKTFGVTGTEVFASRDWIETERALSAGTTATFVGAAVDQPVGQHLTLIGVVGHQDFTDGNRRNHWRARVVYQPWVDLGLTAQIRYRAYKSKSQATTYFNPVDYDEQGLALSYRKRVQGWVLQGTAGVGREHVNHVGKATRLLEISAQSPAKGPYVQFRAGLNRSAGIGGPNYLYRYAAGEIVIPFK